MRPLVGMAAVVVAFAATSSVAKPQPSPRLNFVVIMFDDMSPRVRALGDRVAHTPNLDALARESIAYPNTFTTSPVCAPSRAALFSGRHQQTLGAQHMRTKGAAGLPGGGPLDYEATPPPQVKWLPELLRREGYFTVNVGKTDYQIGDPFTIWDVNAPNADWRKRPKDRPFFAFINLPRTHESYIWPESTTSQDPLARRVAERNRTELAGKPRLTDPARVTVPPYLPDTPLVRADLARLYDNIAYEERKVGEILAALRQDGLLDRTVVIVSADHGDGLPRMKRAIHDAGLRVPLLVRLPEAKGGGTVRPQLVSFVDLAPTILSLARAPAQGWMHGRPFLGSAKRPNKLVFAAADRFDETQERQRTVIDGRYQYIRNYRPDLPQLQRLAFRDQLPTMQEIWRLRAGGALPPLVAQYVAAPKAAEELYDLRADPHTVRNLAADPAAAAHLRRLRRDLATWTRAVGDMSEAPEAEMVARMWPGLVQPRTAPVTISSGRPRRPQTVTLSSATTGASIGYRFKGEAGWRLYTTPFEGPTGAVVEAKAIRYGYAESPLAQFAIP